MKKETAAISREIEACRAALYRVAGPLTSPAVLEGSRALDQKILAWYRAAESKQSRPERADTCFFNEQNSEKGGGE